MPSVGSRRADSVLSACSKRCRLWHARRRQQAREAGRCIVVAAKACAELIVVYAAVTVGVNLFQQRVNVDLWPAMLCKRRRHLLPSDEPGAVRIKLLEGLEQQFVLVQPLLVHCRRQKLLVVDDAVGVDVSTSEHQAGLLLSKLHALLGQRTLHLFEGEHAVAVRVHLLEDVEQSNHFLGGQQASEHAARLLVEAIQGRERLQALHDRIRDMSSKRGAGGVAGFVGGASVVIQPRVLQQLWNSGALGGILFHHPADEVLCLV
mmetsp:Transcript_40874/g.122026  ORF Transcript_40874/g.122026 Transcript_40874/m.122026 type:complete len:262 (-) Transcript_40874:896-1681(-)